MADATTSSTHEALLERVAKLEAALEAERAAHRAEHAAIELARDEAIAERDRLRSAYQQLQLEVELARRRIVVAKAERIDTAQLEIEFAAKLARLDTMGGLLMPSPTASADDDTVKPASGKTKRRGKGRRDLRTLTIPEERIEISDPAFEGSAPRLGTEESCKLMWRRGGLVRVIVSRVKYRVAATADDVKPAIATAEMPRELVARSLATPSLLAHIITDKLCDGLPLHRQEDRFARLGVTLDRGTMSRWIQDVGLTIGATVVHAMHDDAFKNAFCLSTDATGVLVQPAREGDQVRRACRRGHFFVQIADRDAVFFEYRSKETSAVVGEMFQGFSGYIQADAKSVYDLLFRPPEDGGLDDDSIRHEVGCWAHARRKIWEAAITKDPVAREGLARIARIFALDRSFRGRPFSEVKSLRELHMRPHTDAFFEWVALEYDRVRDQRGLLRTALGYAYRQRAPLTTFYDDGRLKLDNNSSERELRRIAVGRKNWLFVGSDDHAQAAGNLLTLIATARLHRLDPELYLRDVIRVLPYWPRDRFLELCPRDWVATRARLDTVELDAELGMLTIPPPPEQSATR